MSKEIERKFLVSGTGWKAGATGRRVRQGYLSSDQQRTVRVRAVGGRGWLTIKGPTVGLARAEYEYEVPLADADAMLSDLCALPLIEKTRYEVCHGGHRWEIDEFHGANEGLVVAEIELASEDEAFERPPWLGEEVSDDPRYFNANLVRRPFSTWQ